jgi:hypothetical protein
MSLYDTAKADIESITSNTDEWGKLATFTAPTAEVETVAVIHNKHHTGFNELGERVNSKYASIAVSESNLDFYGYPVRNADGEVDFKGHLVSIADSTDIVKNYVVREWYPDETVGLIVLILGDYIA